mmetsp:Transcript_15280/g.34863  ORF Transcript_15280/g.34863 Transcript_15280/m.34863 type:complete len:321 (-) Transcript_15280:477-1439(-)
MPKNSERGNGWKRSVRRKNLRRGKRNNSGWSGKRSLRGNVRKRGWNKRSSGRRRPRRNSKESGGRGKERRSKRKREKNQGTSWRRKSGTRRKNRRGRRERRRTERQASGQMSAESKRRIAVLAEGCGAPTGARASEAEIEGGERAPPATRSARNMHVGVREKDLEIEVVETATAVSGTPAIARAEMHLYREIAGTEVTVVISRLVASARRAGDDRQVEGGHHLHAGAPQAGSDHAAASDPQVASDPLASDRRAQSDQGHEAVRKVSAQSRRAPKVQQSLRVLRRTERRVSSTAVLLQRHQRHSRGLPQGRFLRQRLQQRL